MVFGDSRSRPRASTYQKHAPYHDCSKWSFGWWANPNFRVADESGASGGFAEYFDAHGTLQRPKRSFLFYVKKESGLVRIDPMR
jgi:hypothetical protein